MPGTPRSPRSRVASRNTSPTRTGAAARRAPGPLHLTSTAPSSDKKSTDPLRALPTEINQRIFARLSIKALARCSRVCRKWNKSQSLNYGMLRTGSGLVFRWRSRLSRSFPVWFQQYRKHELRDDSLPTGKWTRRESKENWVCVSLLAKFTRLIYTPLSLLLAQRLTYLKSARLTEEADYTSTSRYGYSTPSAPSSSGYATPREIREERWAAENAGGEGGAGIGKVEMREMYKELGGRKSRAKNKVGAGRDRGGWAEGE